MSVPDDTGVMPDATQKWPELVRFGQGFGSGIWFRAAQIANHELSQAFLVSAHPYGYYNYCTKVRNSALRELLK